VHRAYDSPVTRPRDPFRTLPVVRHDGGSAERCDPERLIELVRRGEPAALEDLTRCYGERLLAAGKRHCRTRTEAEDAVQDTLLYAAQGLDSFRGEGSLEGFLSRTVARACRRLSRGQKNDTAAHDTDIELAAADASPEARAAEAELGAALTRLLLELEPRDRAVLLLAELDGYTAPEIGRQLGLSAGAVRTRLTRCRQRLRDGLGAFIPPA
jgi:RNA polymerase sigma-70 factor (ECF subfamily)